MRGMLFAALLAACGPVLAGPAVLVYGDSLSAAYGIAQDAGWVVLLDARLKERNLDYTVVNASVSGETSAGGAARIAAALTQHKPAVVILELGANDGLRGLPVKEMKTNLGAIVRAAKRRGAKVLLVGMRLPPNYGAAYINEFRRTFVDIAREERTGLVPFLLQGVDRRELFQPDNLHPTAEAQGIILENVWSGLAPLLAAKPSR